MRPGQIQPNELEVAILKTIAHTDRTFEHAVARLHVLSRNYTGVGSLTKFVCPSDEPQRHVGLDGHIQIPGLSNGLGAVLFLRGNEPSTLEIYAYGDEHWDGTFDGFAIEDAA